MQYCTGYFWRWRHLDISSLDRKKIVVFLQFPYGLNAKIDFFLQCCLPAGFHYEGKARSSKKHKFYGHKLGISFAQWRLAVQVFRHFYRSFADIEIKRNHCARHEKVFRKRKDETNIENNDPDNLQNKTQWATLNDSRYQGANANFRVIHPN